MSGVSARHPNQRLGDDRHGRNLEPVDRRHCDRPRQIGGDQREGDHHHGRWQGEACPCRQPAQWARPHQPEREADLTRGGTGQKLAEPDEFALRPIIEPTSPLDELGAEITEMGDGPADRATAELEKCGEHFWRTPLIFPGAGSRGVSRARCVSIQLFIVARGCHVASNIDGRARCKVVANRMYRDGPQRRPNRTIMPRRAAIF